MAGLATEERNGVTWFKQSTDGTTTEAQCLQMLKGEDILHGLRVVVLTPPGQYSKEYASCKDWDVFFEHVLHADEPPNYYYYELILHLAAATSIVKHCAKATTKQSKDIAKQSPATRQRAGIVDEWTW